MEGRKHPAFFRAVAYVIEEQKVSIAGVQRRFYLGYGTALKIVEAMELEGVCTGPTEQGMRQVIPKTLEDWNPAAKRGLALEKLGVLMQDPKTTIKDLAGVAHDAGVTISVSIEDEGTA
jgi:hypothetical protein